MVLFGLFRNPAENDSLKFIKEVEEKCELVVDDCFRNALWLAKANEALKEVGGELSEKSYRSKVLVLNGTIEQKLRTASEIINVNVISNLIFEFDSLIQLGISIKKSSEDLDAFHSYAKCLFFSRVGDFLFNRNYERPDSLKLSYNPGIAAYALALNASVSGVPVSPRLAAALNLEILILKILLNENIGDYSRACEDPQVGLYLYQCCGGRSFDHKKALILRSASLSSNCMLSSITSGQRIAKMSVILNEAEVLRKILFIIAYDEEILLSSLSFLDSFFANLALFPDDVDLQSFSVDKTVSLLDVKMLVVAAAEWLHLQNRSKIRHPNYLPCLSRQFLIVWKSIVDQSLKKNKINALAKVKLCSALELTRLRGELPDVRIIGRVCFWLSRYGDPDKRMLKLYINTIIGLEKGTLNNIQNSHASDQIFPKKFDDINTEEETDLLTEIHKLLADKDDLKEKKSFITSSEAVKINSRNEPLKKTEEFVTAANVNGLFAAEISGTEPSGASEFANTSIGESDGIPKDSVYLPTEAINYPLLKRLKHTLRCNLAAESAVDFVRVAAVCGLAEDPRQNGFFEAVQFSSTNVENTNAKRYDCTNVKRRDDSTAYLSHFKEVLDDVAGRQYKELMSSSVCFIEDGVRQILALVASIKKIVNWQKEL